MAKFLSEWTIYPPIIYNHSNQLEEIIYAFYDTIDFSGASFFDKNIRDTHEAYAKIILQHLPYACAFLERYKNSPHITQSLYPWFPYYDRMAHKEYILLIERYLATNPLKHLHLCQNSFLAYGAYCSGNREAFKKYVNQADRYIDSVRKEYPNNFFYYPETRYTIAKVIEAYFNNNENQAITIAQEALKRNENAEPLYVFENFFHTPDILVYLLCNALIWLGKIDFAIEVYRGYGTDLNPIDPMENQTQFFVYQKDSLFGAQTLDMMCLFADDLSPLPSKRKPHWKSAIYEEIQETLIALKTTPKKEISKRHSIKQQLRNFATKTNFSVIEDLIKVFG